MIKTFEEFLNETEEISETIPNDSFLYKANEYLAEIAEICSNIIDYGNDGHPLDDGSSVFDEEHLHRHKFADFAEDVTGEDFWNEVNRYMDYYVGNSSYILNLTDDLKLYNESFENETEITYIIYEDLIKSAMIYNIRNTDLGKLFKNKKIDESFNLKDNRLTKIQDIPRSSNDDYNAVELCEKFLFERLRECYENFIPPIFEYYFIISKNENHNSNINDNISSLLVKHYGKFSHKNFNILYNMLSPEKQHELRKYKMLNKYKNVI